MYLTCEQFTRFSITVLFMHYLLLIYYIYISNTRTLLTRTGYKSLTCVNHQTLHANWAWIKPKVYFIIFKRSYILCFAEQYRFTFVKPLTYDIPYKGSLLLMCTYSILILSSGKAAYSSQLRWRSGIVIFSTFCYLQIVLYYIRI
jgi:hypothetical protein